MEMGLINSVCDARISGNGICLARIGDDCQVRLRFDHLYQASRAMSKAEIIAELPRLSHRDRREIIEHILRLESEAELLADCDRRANERFLMLDAMEEEDG